MMKMDSVSIRESFKDFGIDKEKMIVIIIGFLLGRTGVLGKLTPFGIAFWGAYIIMKGINVQVFISVLIGTLTVQRSTSYVIAYILITLIFYLLKEDRGYSIARASLMISIIFTVCRGMGVLFSKNLFVYDFILVLFEGVLVFTMTYVFIFSVPIEKTSGNILNNEKNICSIITLALALSGIKNIEIFGLAVKNVVCIGIILYLSHRYGGILGGSMGIAIGMIGYISDPRMPFIIGIFGVSGMLGGIFKDLGILGSSLGFILGNGIISFYINGIGGAFLNYKEVIMGVILFQIARKALSEKVFDGFHLDLGLNTDYTQKRYDVVIKKLNKIMELFIKLSNTFKDSAEEKDKTSSLEIYGIVDSIANTSCSKCGRYSSCWERKYYNTYQGFCNVIGLIEIQNLEKACCELDRFCIKHEEIIGVMDRQIDRLKLNHSWKLKLKENRILLSEQLYGMGKLIEDITSDIRLNPKFNREMEEALYKSLKNNRIDVRDISVLYTGDEDFEIFIDLNNPVDKADRLKNIISKTLDFPVISDTTFNGISDKKQRFKLIRNNRFSALTKIVSLANTENKISGDSFTFGDVENNHYAALSDGMGIGRKANAESKAAISLLERLMEANIDTKIILRTINSVLRTKSNEEIFATLDISIIDLYMGKLQVIKNGAPATFVKKKDRVEIVDSNTLPVGMLENIDFNIYDMYLEDGDIIIMMSDGVLDANQDISNREAWMKEIISSIGSINPHTIAKNILEKARDLGGNTRDDMTVLVTKVWKI